MAVGVEAVQAMLVATLNAPALRTPTSQVIGCSCMCAVSRSSCNRFGTMRSRSKGRTATSGGAGVLRVSRGAHQLPAAECLSSSCAQVLAVVAAAAQSKGRFSWARTTRLAKHWPPLPRILHPWPDLQVRRQSPEVGARCVNRARRDLCGGCSAMDIPTATIGHLQTLVASPTAERRHLKLFPKTRQRDTTISATTRWIRRRRSSPQVVPPRARSLAWLRGSTRPPS